ncbi:acetylcholine receptor subunit alpha-like [Mya arenaria]|uniref:acetylcholine receptor subunit alpha-like n=1 Tax=Mya arenaria TaxID=6604 RepID=UPI0022E8D1BB|nr:acetylcholine receptor subunit alpha-like [Mya arenaria]
MLNDYDPRIRPIQNQSQPIYINTKFVPLGLIDFDTTLQQFSMMAYIRIGWIDHNINWTPRFYSATYSLRVPTRQIWTPNLILRKSVDGQGVIGDADTDRIYVSWRGHVQWVPEATYSVVCNVNVRYYPFDEQTCTLTFYVPGESVDTLELDHYKNVDMSECMENAAWIIVGVSRTRHVRDNNYNIDIEFKMQRRADFTTFTLVAPLLMLAFLNICVFLVPSNSGEKGSFSITIFLAYSVYMSMMSETLPHNSVEISFFIVFIIVLLCLSVVSVFYTIIQAKLASAFGNKECPINCFRRTVDRNKVVPVGPAGNLENTCVYTWGNFFDQLDTFLFGSFLVTITLITGIFFSVLLRNVTFDDPDLNFEPEATTRSMPFRTTVAA